MAANRWWFLVLRLLVIGCQPFFGHVSASHVVLREHGYEGLVVAFDPVITQDEGKPLIENIKKLLTEASKALYRATGQGAYFREVNLLVPRAWPTEPDYEKASFETFVDADVRVAEPNPAYGDGPFTVQPLPCGSPGLYIHLTPNYLKNLATHSATVFGDPGKTLVHEWTHLRYGVFDEFGYQDSLQFPPFYYDDEAQKVLPNYCADQKINGTFWNKETGSECELDKDGWPGKNCVFRPVAEETNATSSLMSYHSLPTVHAFCDDVGTHPHNRRAPNKHNALCNSRSVWDVIRNHPDFQGTSNLRNARSAQDLPPKPTFKILQPMEATFSVVLDGSTSMNLPIRHSKHEMLKEVMSRWLKYEVKLGSAVGLISFNETAHKISDIVRLEEDVEKEELVNLLPQRANGYTCVGCGLQMALQQLFDYRKALGGTIILITDGQENKSPYTSDIEQRLVDARVRVISIAYTESATDSLESLANLTGGKVYFVSLKAGVQALGAAFFDAVTYQSSDLDLPVKIHDRRYNEEGSVSYAGNFSVDSTLGKDTLVNFVYLNKHDIRNVSISGPGTNISMYTRRGPRGERVILDDISRLIKFHFPNLTSGTYFYDIVRNGDEAQDIVVTITSKSSRKERKPIIARCWTEKEISPSGNPRFIIVAEVKQGNNPIINAGVIARIERPNDSEDEYLQLFDNGNGAPDITKNDGIYSRYFIKYSGKGRYSVKVQVTDNGLASVQETGFLASSSMPVIDESTSRKNVHQTKTGIFERIVDAGSVQLTEDIHAEKTDQYPPNKVNDLRINNVLTEDGEIIIHWTAPGDDFDYGRASKYEFRYSTSWDDLHNTWFNGTLLSVELSSPRDAGTAESIKVNATPFVKNETYFLAMRAYDDVNHSSLTSNIIQISRLTETASQKREDYTGVALVLAILGGILLSTFAIVSYVCCRRNTKTHHSLPEFLS